MAQPPAIILVVEDNLEVQEVAVVALSLAGYEVLTAANGTEALKTLADRRVDLLLTDVLMPGIDGFRVAEQAKLLSPALKVLYVTGYQELDQDTPREKRHGKLIRKPYRIEQLLAEVKRTLEG